ncbi:Hpt domain-containing protein [Dyadobacter sp. SG02]|uniref:Hpt domain-containing protein n=1 Tax=Dyadobacter sp. SG02 TaxID=1855291 RepID=UPI0008ADB2DB|nr:Hpt domain-containing protein [Dyadobacter sp. SG02]SEI56430.1 Hpt domain-containing protein [Dyadobacter sp. SG02]
MDLSLLHNLMGGDQRLVDRFVAIFNTQVPAQVAALPELCEAQDWEGLSTALHSLKTQFNYVGMHTLAEQIRSLEEQVDAGLTDGISLPVNHFVRDFRLS